MPRPLTLNPVEARLLGVLVEKALTTPDQYPLSLNALLNGSNQKSNRDPVTELMEAEVLVGLDGLRVKQLVAAISTVGSRVEKYRQNAESVLGVTTGELAVLTELLLRGPQAPGELRARVSRMVPLASLSELQGVLASLGTKGYVVEHPPVPGSRARRFGHTLLEGAAGPLAETELARRLAPVPRPHVASETSPTDVGARVAALEATVVELSARLARLEHELGA